jgi:C4-dicarboxylate-specific signal transduction histidine kinase
MSCNWNIIGETGLQFFGKMSASISHEIKNALAIINENAGLLHDYTQMADKGMAITPERLKTLAQKFMDQIRRADGIVKNMNRFAHSVDDSIKNIELGELLEFVAALCSRFAFMRGVALEPASPVAQVKITTNPFFLENLIWLCLEYAMGKAGQGKTVGLVAEETEDGARIRIFGLQELAAATADVFPSERAEALLGPLRAQLMTDAGAGELLLILPKTVEV